MAYNKNTDWDNERKYLDNLSKTGDAGQKAWAENQKKELAKAESQYGGSSGSAKSGGSTSGNGSSSSGSSSSKSVSKTGSSSSKSSGNSPYTNLGSTYDPKTDYQAIINDAVANGDYETAAIAEQLRNQKIFETGRPYATTNNYSGYLNATPAPTQSGYKSIGTHNDSSLPSNAMDEINVYKKLYNDAIASGNTEAAKAAHAAAERLRAEYGYLGGVDGSDYIGINKEVSFDPQSIAGWADYEEDTPKPTLKSKYDPQVNALLKDILNRDDFSYDVKSDPLYQQIAQTYHREGDRAMEETMAEAASYAGGMNTFAVTAAQQAANRYAAELNDRIPELYQLAYDMYLSDKESAVENLGILQQLSNTEYNRYRDTMEDWKGDRSFAYGAYQDALSQNNWQTNFGYNALLDNRDFIYNDYWKNKEWNVQQDEIDYNKGIYDRESAREEAKWLISMGVPPDAALIQRAGMNPTTVAQAVAEAKAKLAGGGKSSGDGNSTSGGGGDDTQYSPKPKPVDDMQDYTVTNNHGDSWVYVYPIGRLSYKELYNMVENGSVVEEVDKNSKKISYKKA